MAGQVESRLRLALKFQKLPLSQVVPAWLGRRAEER